MNGEMDFMILNNKVKGVQGTVDNIDTNMQSMTAQLMSVVTNIETNNTASAVGTLSQKLSYIIENAVSENTPHGTVVFDTAGTHIWTCPEGVYEVWVIMCGGAGGGGGGGGGYKTTRSGGGGGAGCAPVPLFAAIKVTPNTTYEIVVGAGGAKGAGGSKYNYGKDGGSGEPTKFADILEAAGGSGGGFGYAGYDAGNGTGGAGKADAVCLVTERCLIINHGSVGAGGNGTDANGSTPGVGGIGNYNSIQIKGGNGGAGGAIAGAGSAGTAGDAGKLIIIW